MIHRVAHPWRWLTGVTLGALLLGGCALPAPTNPAAAPPDADAETTAPAALMPADLAGGKLRVVATTTLVGDVVRQVGGDRIELTTLFAPGSDPHAYQLTPGDRRALDGAQIIFVNGLGLEESVLPVVGELTAPVVAVNDGVATLAYGAEDGHDGHAHDGHAHDDHAHEGEAHEGEAHAEEDHDHEGEAHTEEAHTEEARADAQTTATPVAEEHADEAHADEAHDPEHAHHHHDGDDPHTWQSVPSVMMWVDNVAAALSARDPANAAAYADAAAAYRAELAALDGDLRAQLATLPEERRKLVSDHGNLGYFAAEYGFTVIGTVIPSLSTAAAASAQELAALQDQITAEGVPAIFVGSTVNPRLADQLAQDLGVQVVPIYTDSLSDASGPAATYVDMMRSNVAAIVAALQ